MPTVQSASQVGGQQLPEGAVAAIVGEEAVPAVAEPMQRSMARVLNGDLSTHAGKCLQVDDALAQHASDLGQWLTSSPRSPRERAQRDPLAVRRRAASLLIVYEAPFRFTN